MLTFRRVLIVALTILAIFLLFGGKGRIDSNRFFHDEQLEKRLLQVQRELLAKVAAVDELSNNRVSKLDEKITKLEIERSVLEQQIQELRRLPEGATVRQQLAYQFPYHKSSRFPAYIWQTWKHGRNDAALEEHIHQFMQSWDHHGEGFVHEVLSDDVAEKIVSHLFMNVPDVIDAYKAMPENILKADFFRYLILLARGGTYSDADTELLKPIPVWIPGSLNPLNIGVTIGIEADPDRPDWAEWYARRIQFCQWTIQSKPGHPILREVVARITEKTLAKKKKGSMFDASISRGTDIMDWTGPGIWTDSVMDYFNAPTSPFGPTDWHNFTGLAEPKLFGDVLILPITSFSPGVDTMGSKSESDPLAFVKHHFEGSWKDDKNKKP